MDFYGTSNHGCAHLSATIHQFFCQQNQSSDAFCLSFGCSSCLHLLNILLTHTHHLHYIHEAPLWSRDHFAGSSNLRHLSPTSLPKSKKFLCFCADIDKSGFVSDYELQELFREASVYLPGYKVRDIIETFISGDTNKDQKISFEEFVYVSVDSVKIRAHAQTDVRTDSA